MASNEGKEEKKEVDSPEENPKSQERVRKVSVPIYRWSGEYFGFIRNGRFFDADGNYLGWVGEDSKKVWRADGKFLGEIVDGNYILRNLSMVEPVPKVPKVAPVPPVPLVPAVNRVGRVPKVGWKDALDDYE